MRGVHDRLRSWSLASWWRRHERQRARAARAAAERPIISSMDLSIFRAPGDGQGRRAA